MTTLADTLRAGRRLTAIGFEPVLFEIEGVDDTTHAYTGCLSEAE